MSQESKAYVHQSALGLIGNAIAIGKANSTGRMLAMYGTIQKSVDAEEADSETDEEREKKAKTKTKDTGEEKTGLEDAETEDEVKKSKEKEKDNREQKRTDTIQKSYNQGQRKVETFNKSYDGRIGQMAYNRDAFMQMGREVKVDSNTIEKSNSAINALRYTAKVKKTGKEIKEKLTGVKTQISASRDKAKSAFEGVRKKITEEPKVEYTNYSTRELEKHMPEMPKTYEYNQMYPSDLASNCLQPIDMVYSNDAKAKSEEIAQAQYMREYNNLIYQYADACCDLCYLETLNNNISDEQEIELSVQDLATLGF